MSLSFRRTSFGCLVLLFCFCFAWWWDVIFYRPGNLEKRYLVPWQGGWWEKAPNSTRMTLAVITFLEMRRPDTLQGLSLELCTECFKATKMVWMREGERVLQSCASVFSASASLRYFPKDRFRSSLSLRSASASSLEKSPEGRLFPPPPVPEICFKRAGKHWAVY